MSLTDEEAALVLSDAEDVCLEKATRTMSPSVAAEELVKAEALRRGIEALLHHHPEETL